MMIDRAAMAGRFQANARRPVPASPTTEAMTLEMRIAHAKVLLEETLEAIEAMGLVVVAPSRGTFTATEGVALLPSSNQDAVRLDRIAHELTDVAYINETIVVMYGLPSDDLFAEVHRSNMTRFDDDGVILRHPTTNSAAVNYSPPDIEGVLQRAQRGSVRS